MKKLKVLLTAISVSLFAIPGFLFAQTTYTISGNIYYVGNSIVPYVTGAPATTWLRDVDTDEYLDIGNNMTYDDIDGSYDIVNVPPGSYSLVMRFDGIGLPPTGGNYGGDFHGAAAIVVEDADVNQDINCIEIIRLTTPIDNTENLGYSTNNYPSYDQNTIQFSWDAIDEANEYRYRVDIYTHNPWALVTSNYRSGITEDLYVLLSLEDNEIGEHYQFRVNAYNNGTLIADFIINYINGYGWDYRFIVGGCTASISAQTDVLCYGDATGSAQVIATGGMEPYSYQWDDPAAQITAIADGLIAGEYEVTVTDNNSCIAYATATINEPDELIATVISTTDETCIGCADGSIVATASGGTSPYTFHWTGPDGYSYTGAMGTIAGLSAGDYYLEVTDNNACTTEILHVFIGNPLIVTNTEDSGPGSLRNALESANAHPGPDEIQFNIPGTDVHLIVPNSPLPTITESLVINGFSQPGSMMNTNLPGLGLNTEPKIELEGTNAGDPATGLIVLADECEISGLIINRFSNRGIELWGDNNIVNECFIGSTASGDQAAGNAQQGVLIAGDATNNVIGPNNVISGNENWGIQIHSVTATNNRIINNYIGTDHTGTQPMDVSQAGVYITDSPGNLVDGNVICGTGSGSGVAHNAFMLQGADTKNNVIQNNYIGTNALGNQGLGFASSGIIVFMGASSNEIGPNNVISGNAGGIQIEGLGTDNTSVFGNYIGTNQSSSSAIGNTNTGVYVALGARNTVIGPGNTISNNDNGIHIENETTTLTTIIGNYIGTNVDGTSRLGNSNIGVWIAGSPNNVIGGKNLAERNVISGNTSDGILLVGLTAVGNEVYGNYIGTDVTGNISIKNGSVGIAINDASNSIIGGLEPGEGNIISDIGIGNSGATGNHIIGNYIGINADGDQALDPGKGNAGVFLSDASENVIGPGNILSGNQEGIVITSSDYGSYPDRTVQNKIIGNLIGTNAAGDDAIPNQQGILVEGSLETTIGGAMDGERNIISGNLYEGIAIRSENHQTRVFNNYIGSDKTGENAIPNDMGIKINSPSTETYIGGGANGPGNLIAFNNGSGIGVDAHQNYIQGNIIHGNSSNGIYITGNQNTVGGPNVADRNYIYGNDGGISNFYNSNQNLIQWNVLGTDPEGVEDKTDSWDGIAISGSDNVVKDNLISGYQNQGILITRWSPDENIPQRNRIEQNRIGLALNGGGFIPNGHGISLNTTTDNVIIGNEVAGNNWNAIALRDDFGAVSINNLISQNLVYSNGGIGIDLISDGPTPNDEVPLDPDEGPNHLQNFPVLDYISFGEGNVTVKGVLRSEANSTYNLEFFASGVGDPTTYGEGEFYLGSEAVQTDGNGDAFFEFTLPAVGYGAQVISATATDEDGNTSEFSQVIGGEKDQVLAEMPFVYTLNSEGLSTVPLADYQDAIRSAFQTWNAIPTAEIQMDEAEDSSDEKYASATDGINLVSFEDDRFPFAKGVLAVTAKTLRITSGGTAAEILDADIIFNPAYIHDPVRPFAVLAEGDTTTTAFDIQTVATHEIGHVLGMIHSGVYSSTMFFMLGYGTTERELDQDDMAWASYRYPSEDFQSNYGLVSGRVTYGDLGDVANPSTHPPVAGALVLAVNTEGQPLSHAYTDADGNYTVPVPMDGVLSDECYIYIQPLDGDVFGTPLTPANISPYIYSHTIFTDYPNEFYDDQEGADEDGNPGDGIQVTAGGEVTGIDLITNRDLTAPQVIGTSLDVQSVDVPVSPTVAIKFSEPVDIYSFDENSCYFEGSGVILGGEYTLLADSTHIVLMKPVESLQYSTDYTLVIDGITDLKGNTMETAYTSDFTTRDPDTEAPWVYDVIPADGLSQVDVTKPVKIFFSEPMDKLSVETGFSLMNSESLLVTGDYKWDLTNKEMTLYPDFSLEEGTDYVINITTQAMDLSGNPMENQAIFTFSTVDVAAPQILYLGPADRSTGITMETPVVVKMSEPLDLTTITSNSFFLADSVTAVKVNGTYEYLDDDRTIIFRPDQSLSFDQPYTITLKSAISDLSNPKQYLEDTTTSFRTAPYIVVPHITYMEPPFGAEGAQTTIVGSGFDPQPLNNIVMFNGSAATVKKATLQSLTVNVPYLAYDGPVTVTVNGVASDNSFEFDVVPPNTDPSYSVIASSKTGSNTRAVVINPDAAYAYVTNWGDNTVTPIDLSGNTPVPEENIPVGVEPMDIDLNPAGTLAYVTNYLSNTVSVIGTDIGVDATYHKVAKTIPVGYHPYGVAASSDKLVYVANNESEYVSVIDVDPNSGGFDHVIANVTTGTKNRSIVVTPDAGLILVTGDNGVIIIDRDPGSDTFNDVIATASSGSTTRHVTITPDAALALATTEDGVILIIDIFQPAGTQFGSVIASVKTGSSARNVTISPDAMYVYITNPDDNTVSVYQLDYSIIPGYGASLNNPLGLLHVTTIEVGNTPYAIAGHPSSEYFLVTHDSEEGGVSKVGVKEESVNVIYTLGELISSVENALKDGDLTGKIGGKLLVDLQKTKDRINSGQLESAIDHLDNFISRVHKWISTGEIEEDLGNAWLEAAYRIRDQLLKDLEEQQSLLKGSGVPDPEIRTLNDRQNSISNQGDLRPGSTLKLENRPNPFSYHTQVYFEIPENGQADVPVVIRVFNINGQVIKTLVHQDMKAGRYMLNWNCDLDDGGLVQDGIYLLELMTPNERETIRISVIK